MKPVCMPCKRFFRPKTIGFFFLEGYPAGDGSALPGISEQWKWKPYKIWHGDVWECHGCGATIIVGVAQKPINEHYTDTFEADIRGTRADQFQVNDC